MIPVYRWFFTVLMSVAGLSLSACSAIEPSSIVDKQRTARPEEKPETVAKNGAIFKQAKFRSIYEDYKAHDVGDVITVVIQEKVSADKKNAASDTKSGSIDTNLQKFFGIPMSGMNSAEETSMTSNSKDTGSASYNFTGTIAVTVIEVLPNGNLVVSGEKQIGMDKGTEFIRLSGVVVPQMITVGNTLPSSKLADARVEYRTNAQVDTVEVLKSLQRVFSAVLLL